MLDDVPKIFEAVFQCTLEVGVSTLLSVFFCEFFLSISKLFEHSESSEHWLDSILIADDNKEFRRLSGASAEVLFTSSSNCYTLFSCFDSFVQ